MNNSLILNRDYIKAVDNSNPLFLQNLFFQGNGEVGLRCVLPGDEYEPWIHGIFRAGVFEYIKTGITDMVNLPDPVVGEIRVDGVKVSGNVDDFSETLYFSSGKVERDITFLGRKIKIERILSLSCSSEVAMRITFPLNRGVDVDTYIDSSVLNMPVNDDQSISDDSLISLYRVNEERDDYLSVSTLSSRFTFKYYLKRTREIKEDSVILSTVVSIDNPSDKSFSDIEMENISHLSSFWRLNDIVIDGPEEDQCALRYNILMLYMNSPRKDVSIGARGLAHPRYKGCYFWDSEVFLLPYYLVSNPKAAKHMVRYRLNNLEGAKKNAVLHSNSGARFPWMCSLDGSEQCESWDIGKCEIHVTADVAWAIDKYIKSTGDREIEKEAAELYLETARFWKSRFSYEKRSDTYKLLFVKGPDEYCGVTHNNTYTSLMAAHNINLALDSEKKGLINISEEEKEEFLSLINKMEIPYSKEYGTYLEDDSFLFLEDVDIRAMKDGGEPLYRKLCFDRLQRMKVLKQPDVILLYLTLPNVFSKKEALNAWNLYEPLTVHDSTLSWGMHALSAYKLGLEEKGDDYFFKSLFLDLKDNMDNTEKEGIHIGAMGGTMQSVMFGMIDIEKMSSYLPPSWKRLETTIFLSGTRKKVIAEKGKLTLLPLE